MSPEEMKNILTTRGCAIVSDNGSFALVYPDGYNQSKKAVALTAVTHAAALIEAWEYLHPEAATAGRIGLIQRLVAADFNLTVEDMLAYDRTEPIATARRTAMAIAKSLTKSGDGAIAPLFKRERSLILHARQSVADQITTDSAFAARFGALLAACRKALNA